MRNLRGLIKNDEYDQGGWCNDEKRNVINFLVNLTNSKFCVEIGVYKGSSLLCFAEALENNNGQVIGVDPWSFEMSKNDIGDKEFEDYLYNQLLVGQGTFDLLYENLSELIKNNNLTNTIKLIRKPSEVAFLDFEKESIDILHIDGNHNELNVSRDILLYLPLVKKSGYIIMDDVGWRGVNSAISKFLMPHCELIQKFNDNFSCYKKI
jgi:predicted O-methyltransferase YrrM